MGDRIIHKRSLTAGSVPTTSSLEVGELAVNVADGKIHLRRSGSAGNDVLSLVTANTITTGSIQATAGFTGSLFGTASWAGNFNETDPIFVARSGSLVTTSSFTQFTSSIQNQVNSLTNATSSYVLNSQTSSMTVLSSSYADNLRGFVPSDFAKLTGGNSFTGDQTITGNLNLIGTASFLYTTASQLDIGTNIISVNTNAAVRFGGLAVIDSGSIPRVSGSLLFDSQNNQWIFVHQDGGGAVTSSVLIMGPQTFNSVGNETTITANKLTKGTGGDLGEHIGDSNITDTGTLVSINSNTQVTGSLLVTGGITGSLRGTASYADFALNSSVSTSGSTLYSTNPATSNFSLNNNILLGPGAGEGAYRADDSNFFGYRAGYGAIDADNSTFIGYAAGFGAYLANNSNFFGRRTGFGAISASYSTLIGDSVGASTGLGTNNIIIGTNITLENNRKDSINLGGIVFATGSYNTTAGDPFSGSMNTAKVGIGTSLPQYTLDVSGSGRFVDNLIVSGTLIVNSGITGSLQGTASNAVSSSYADTALNAPLYVLSSATSSMLAPYVLNSTTSSFVQNSVTASMLSPYVLNSATSSFVTNNQTSSFVQNSVTASMLSPYVLTSVTSSMLQPYVLSSSTSSFVQNSVTASMLDPYVLTSATSSMTVLSSSFATTASYISPTFISASAAASGFGSGGGSGTGFPFTGSAQITGSLGVTGSVSATSFTGDGSGLTNLPPSGTATLFNYYNFI